MVEIFGWIQIREGLLPPLSHSDAVEAAATVLSGSEESAGPMGVLAVIEDRVRIALAAWCEDPSNVVAYQRLVEVVEEWTGYLRTVNALPRDDVAATNSSVR